MNILAIGAHPADTFDLGGGTMANFAADGHDVYLAVVTHGAYSHAPMVTKNHETHPVAEVAALKREECEAAAKHTGIKQTRYFGFDDEPFIPTRQVILAVAEYVREVRPDVILTHHPQEYGHPDHPLVGEVALRALKAAERWLEGSTLPSHPIKRVYFFGTQFRGICANLGAQVVAPDFVVDIARSIDKKKRAIASFHSQAYRGAQYEEKWVNERIERIEGYWGIMSGLKYAEEFIALTPQIVQSLPG